MSTCTGRGSQAAPCPPAHNVNGVGPRAYRTGGSSDTQTISPCSGTVTRQTSKPYANEISGVLATMGLTFSEAKTRVVHMSEGFDFLGFHIQWKRKRGTNTLARLHLHRGPADPVVEGESTCPDEQDVTAAPGIRADPARSDHARMVNLLPPRRQQTHLLDPCQLRVASGRPVADDAAPLEVDGFPTTVHRPRRPVETLVGGRESLVQPRSGPGHPIPLPREHPDPVGDDSHITAGSVESPLRREAHGGFGERSGETNLSNQDTAPQADSTPTSTPTGRSPGTDPPSTGFDSGSTSAADESAAAARTRAAAARAPTAARSTASRTSLLRPGTAFMCAAFNSHTSMTSSRQ